MDVVSFCGSVSITLLNQGRYRGMASPPVMRVPTNRTEDYNEKDANLRIKMDQDQPKSPKAQMFSCECSFSLPVSALVVS